MDLAIFFNGDRKSTLDHILLNTFLSSSIVECYTHGHNDLIISISLEDRSIVESRATSPTKINCKKATEISFSSYVRDVSHFISPLLSSTFPSITELNDEIIFVTNVLARAASKHLPHVDHHKSKPYIKDSELHSLFVNRVEQLGSSGSLLDVWWKDNYI